MEPLMIRPIRSEDDYHAALSRLEGLMSATPDTPEFDELEVLSVLVEKYEQVHYPVPPPTPLGAIRFRMEQMNLTQADLARVLGSASRASEILSGQRPLSLGMIYKVRSALKIPADVLLPAPRLVEKRPVKRSTKRAAASPSLVAGTMAAKR